MSKKKPWFIKKRGSYLPCSWQGWLTYIPFAGYLIGSFFVANHRVDSISDLLYVLVPQWVAAAVILTWVAERTS